MKYLIAAILIWMQAALVWASDAIDDLSRLLMLQSTAELMQDEGMRNARTTSEDFTGQALGQWDADGLRAVYAPDRSLALFRQAFEARLSDEDIATLVDAFGAPFAARVVGLEVTARAAISEEDIEAAAIEMVNEVMTSDRDRIAVIDQIIEVNDLIALNLDGGEVILLEFYKTLATGNVRGIDYAVIAEEIQSQRQERRDDLIEWLRAFFVMAYSDLNDDELLQVLALYESEEAQKAIGAMFEVFNLVEIEAMRKLGDTIARQMNTSKL